MYFLRPFLFDILYHNILPDMMDLVLGVSVHNLRKAVLLLTSKTSVNERIDLLVLLFLAFTDGTGDSLLL